MNIDKADDKLAKILARQNIRDPIAIVLAVLIAWALVALFIQTVPLVPGLILVGASYFGAMLLQRLLYKLFGA